VNEAVESDSDEMGDSGSEYEDGADAEAHDRDKDGAVSSSHEQRAGRKHPEGPNSQSIPSHDTDMQQLAR